MKVKRVLEELSERRRRLATLRFGEDKRLLDLLTWLENQPDIRPLLDELRESVDVDSLISPHGFRPRASSHEQTVAIGLRVLDQIKGGSDILNVAMKMGIRPNHSTRNGQDYLDEAMTCYVNPLLDFLEEQLKKRMTPATDTTAAEMPSITHQKSKEALALFISHSSRDEKLAAVLVELIRGALNLPAQQIRCTSVNGYRLPIGTPTEERLRDEVHQARAFIGLITPSSIESAYVMFELGARWGAKLHLAPLLGAGADNSYLRGPLGSLNALNCEDTAQVHQLIDDLAVVLEVQERTPAAAYQKDIERLIAASKAGPLELGPPGVGQLEGISGGPNVASAQLTKLEAEIIAATPDHGWIYVARSDAYGSYVDAGDGDFFRADDASHQAKYLDALDLLLSRGLIRSEGTDAYRLTGHGFELRRRLSTGKEK